MKPLCTVIFFVTTLLYGVYCSHFRGGLITWKPAGTNQIEISYRVAFRRSSLHMCHDDTIANKSLVSGEGNLQCLYGCNGTITQMSYYCTDFSATEDWTTGTRSVIYQLPVSQSKVFHFGYGSCCWIRLAEGGSGWMMRTTADLNMRKDTGKLNSSPITGMQPIVRFSHGCSYTLKIPVADDDGDIVKCRWSRRSPFDECSGVCKTFSGSYLDQDSCIMTYNATGRVGWFAVALQIEDFASSADTIALSSVSLQFLVYVSYSTEPCSSQPIFPADDNPNIITDGSVYNLLVNSLFNVTIVARSGSDTLSISEITTLSPQGMIKSTLFPHGTSGREWFVYVIWVPTIAQVGSHVFCYSATDNKGQTSDQVCATLKVHELFSETTMASNNNQDKQTTLRSGSNDETTCKCDCNHGQQTTIKAGSNYETTQGQNDDGVVILNPKCTDTVIPNEIKRICSAGNLPQYYFATSCPSHFLQCNDHGSGYIMPCAPGTVWCQAYLTCVHKNTCPVSECSYGWLSSFFQNTDLPTIKDFLNVFYMNHTIVTCTNVFKN